VYCIKYRVDGGFFILVESNSQRFGEFVFSKYKKNTYVFIFNININTLSWTGIKKTAICSDIKSNKIKRTLCFNISKGSKLGHYSSVGIATRYGLCGPGTNTGGGEIFHTRPECPWGPSGLLYNGYRFISQG
jgi:hypothetical protein